MGWFDDSDSDEGGGFGKKSAFSKSKSKKKREREQRRAPPLDFFTDVKDDVGAVVGAGASLEGGGKGEEGKEEVDPLDAYMSGITAAASAGKGDGDDNGEDGGGTVKRMRAERLDMENEDEATAHWTNGNGNVNGVDAVDGASAASRRLLPPPDSDRDDTRDTPTNTASANISTSSLAKMAMASTFHRAGSKPKPSSSNNHNKHQNDLNEYDDYDEDDLKRIAEETAKQQRNQSIDPLENVDHASTKYESFRKSFLPPTATIFTTSAKQWRNDNHVTCSMDLDPIPSFACLGPATHSSTNTSNAAATVASNSSLDLLPLPVIQYLETAGFRKPTPVQAQGIPVALAGRDLLVTSSTGSGKTLAYSLPILTHILDQPHIVPNQDGPITLILAPTRELARQIHLLLKKLLSLVGGTAIAVAGGNEGTYELSRKLKKGCEAVVSTPGRFIDLVKRGATNCTRVTLLVLDEADRMLHMGFEEQVGSILRNVRPDRQSFLFSATFDKRLEKVASRWLKDPVRIAIGRTGSSSEHVTQHVLVLPTREAKKQWMAEMLPVLADLGKTIIFVSSRADCDELAQYLHQHQQSQSSFLPVDCIHGDRHQSDRNAALSALKKGKLAALVATDVAARGLDVPDIATVVNFDPAKNWDSHVHRVGRAGRLSRRSTTDSDGELQQQQQKKGCAYTLLTPKNADFAKVLVDAFEREQREVSEELVQLARKSRRFAGGAGGQRWNRSGLGFHQGPGSGPSFSMGAKTGDGNYGPSGHYGPST